MTDKQSFEIEEYPKNGRLAKYEKELAALEKAKDNEGIITFSHRLFCDCSEYLKSTFQLHLSNLYLNFLNHREFTDLADKMDAIFGAIPRHRAMIVGDRLGSPPQIYIDFQNHIEGYRPAETIVNLCASYMEELIHASDPNKNETQIQDIVCSAIEGFLEIKLPDALKQYRLDYSNTCDELQAKKNLVVRKIKSSLSYPEFNKQLATGHR